MYEIFADMHVHIGRAENGKPIIIQLRRDIRAVNGQHGGFRIGASDFFDQRLIRIRIASSQRYDYQDGDQKQGKD